MKACLSLVVIGISSVLFCETGFSLGASGTEADRGDTNTVHKKERDVAGEVEGGEDDTPEQGSTLPPPAYDSDMVIQPDVPPDPDAVVEPPPVDPEMAVDPMTRQPKTKEELEGFKDSEQHEKEKRGRD
jgi:hypothetical protein